MTGQLRLPDDHGGTPAIKKFDIRAARAFAEAPPEPEPPEPEPEPQDEDDDEPDPA